MNEIWSLVNSLPHALLGMVTFAFIYGFVRLGMPLLINIKNAILKVYNHNKELFSHGNDYMLANALHDLGHIIQTCFNKGGKTMTDVFNYGEVRHHYRNLDGNKVLDILDYIFIHEIPFITVMEVPLKAGNAQPPKETIETMVDFYKKVTNGIIPSDEVESPKNIVSKRET